MNFPRLSLVLFASSTLLTNCGTVGPPPIATITINPQITSLAVNGTQTFTATVTGASSKNVVWQLHGEGSGIDGSFSGSQPSTVTGSTVTYNAPATPPIYSEATVGAVGALWSGQGTTAISASIPSGDGFADASVGLAITGPTSVGITPETTSVQLGKLVYLYPYCVGWANNGINWTVNGVANGNSATGTMTTDVQIGAYYTAPATMPMTGSTVTVTVICQADPTKTASTTITLTQ
jgi:hypothetical protein